MSLGLQVGVLPVLDNARFYARDHELKGEVVGTSLHPFIPGGEANEEGWESKLDVSIVSPLWIDVSLTSNDRLFVRIGHQKNSLALRG